MTDNNLQNFINADQYLETSLSLYTTNKNEEAIALIDKAIACDPNFAEAYNRKGDCLIKLGRIEEALECYQKSHDLNPNIQNNYFDLGRTYLILGKYEESLENFKTANRMRPQPDIHAFIGKIYFDQNKLEEAKASFENVLGIEKENLEKDISLSSTQENEEAEESKSIFKKAVNLIKNAGSSLANYYYSRLKSSDEDGNVKNNLSKLSEEEKTALRNAAKKVINAAGNTMAVYYYAQILVLEGKEKEAKAYFDKIIEKYSMIVSAKKDAAEAYYYIGKANFFTGNYAEAEKNLKLAVQLDTDKIYNHYSYEMFYSDADAFAALAEAQSKLGNTAEAKENILKAISLEPNNKKLLDLKFKLGY